MLDKDKLLSGKRVNNLGKFARREAKEPDLQQHHESKTWIHPPSSGQSPSAAAETTQSTGQRLQNKHTRLVFCSPFNFMLLHRLLLFAIPPLTACCTPVLFPVIAQCTRCCTDGFFSYLPERRRYGV